ncbi:hypothetical protein RvY_02878 [Ramazzottius varieornatus]|uniref:Uncharacterized protein n=1 Tax=Ramazzottius varieornatus TaxID=947166 RepID=A0A1D1UL67_RAMVA|nr:hypothetical protein RvY_02878 [Ramazzottius varieornatus]
MGRLTFAPQKPPTNSASVQLLAILGQFVDVSASRLVSQLNQAWWVRQGVSQTDCGLGLTFISRFSMMEALLALLKVLSPSAE